MYKAIRQKVMQPHTWEAADGGYDIGDEKTFADGSTRVLNYSKTGVRRWLGIHDEKNKDVKPGQQSGQQATPQPALIELPPEQINRVEWLGFNKYLTEDNPFLNCRAYDEVVAKWFTQAYELANRLAIIEESKDLYGDGIKDEKKNVMDKIKLLDNYYLAYQMYKVSYLIDEVTKLDPEFNYDEFLQEAKWQDLIDYLDHLREPQEVDYKQLYQEENEPAEPVPGNKKVV